LRNYSAIGLVLPLLVGLLVPRDGALGQSNEENGRQKGAEDLAREGVEYIRIRISQKRARRRRPRSYPG
jgi:hypothetical protein